MKEYFHVLGNIPVCIDLLNKKVIIGDKINAVSLRKFGRNTIRTCGVIRFYEQ